MSDELTPSARLTQREQALKLAQATHADRSLSEVSEEDGLKPCPIPWCMGMATDVCRQRPNEFYVSCDTCGLHGPVENSPERSRIAWNNRRRLRAPQDEASRLNETTQREQALKLVDVILEAPDACERFRGISIQAAGRSVARALRSSEAEKAELRKAMERIVEKSDNCFAADMPPMELENVRDYEEGRRLSYSVVSRIARQALSGSPADPPKPNQLWRVGYVSQNGSPAIHDCVHEAEALACAIGLNSGIAELSVDGGKTWNPAVACTGGEHK